MLSSRANNHEWTRLNIFRLFVVGWYKDASVRVFLNKLSGRIFLCLSKRHKGATAI